MWFYTANPVTIISIDQASESKPQIDINSQTNSNNNNNRFNNEISLISLNNTNNNQDNQENSIFNKRIFIQKKEIQIVLLKKLINK